MAERLYIVKEDGGMPALYGFMLIQDLTKSKLVESVDGDYTVFQAEELKATPEEAWLRYISQTKGQIKSESDEIRELLKQLKQKKLKLEFARGSLKNWREFQLHLLNG